MVRHAPKYSGHMLLKMDPVDAPPGHSERPEQLLGNGVRRTLKLAATWLVWDGRPRLADDGMRLYTPHKAIRRFVDHLVDHLAEIEALLAGVPTQDDHWLASGVTLASDWAQFTEPDLNEARERLTRLGQIYAVRLGSLSAEELDASRLPNRTIREIVEHVFSPWYAEQVGDLIHTQAV
jgi:hypothetical protein